MQSSGAGARSSHILNFQAVGRVIDRVRQADANLGAAYELPATGDPADWDRVREARSDLSSSISWAYTLREAHPDWTSDSRARRRYEAIGRVRRLSRELTALIHDDQMPLSSSLAPRFPVTDEHGFHVVDFSQFMAGLERLQEACIEERERLKELGLHEKAVLSQVGDDADSLSTPGAAFISRMGKAFEEAFEQAPSIRFTNDREPAGPFVQFVEAVTMEMGEPMSRDGIRKAWDRASGGRTKAEEILKPVP